MVQDTQPATGDTISEGLWTTKLFERVEYFNSNKDLEQMSLMLPFGLLRQRKPRDYEKKEEKRVRTMRAQALMMRTRRLGMFYAEEGMEIKSWKPEQTIMQIT